MGIAKPTANSADAEASRALLREMHEAIRDGRALLRELRAAMAEADGKTAAVQAEANKRIAELQKHIDGVAAVVQQQLDDQSDAMSQQINNLLGMQDGHELLKAIAKQVIPVMRDAVLAHVDKKLPGIVTTQMEAMAARGNRKYGEQLRAAIRLADAVVRPGHQGDSGADGTVPGGDGH